MHCPHCERDTLAPRATATGVELDRCESCGSIWLDRGELFFFVKDIPGYQQAIHRARQAAMTSDHASPRTGERMVELTVPGGQKGYLDRGAGGIWFPGTAARALADDGFLKIGWSSGEKTEPRRFKLPNLMARTIFTMAGLYALLSFVLITISLMGGISSGFALLLAAGVLLLQFLLGPFIMDVWLRWAYRAKRVAFAELPSHLQEYVRATSETHRMKIPRFAMIPDLSPNAFTYGHTPNNARIVLTEGMLELLEEKELHGVVGHEMGHARNWDMALMTAAQLVPMVLYYIYRWAIRIDTDDGRAKAATTSVAIGAYVLYIVSEYIVLWFSRTREYYADRFGARSVNSPAALARALVKIGYGLAGRGGDSAADGARGKQRAGAVGALGIFDGQAAQTLAVATHSAEAEQKQTSQPTTARYQIDSESIKGAMKWDLWNPWAMYFELHSTHPLIAKRLLALSTLSQEMGEEPLVRFDLPKPESYWDEFLVDLGIKLAPLVGFIAAISLWLGTGSVAAGGIGVVCAAAAMMYKLRFTYPTRSFPEMSVATLLRQVKVSGVRPVPCHLVGSIRGKGVPGLVWSDDFTMQDDTGIIFLDHRQPLSIWEAIWGWMRGDGLIGEEVEVDGWYRRAPMPFVEIKSFTIAGVTRKSWLRHFRWATAVVVAIAGIGLIVVA